MSKYPNLSEADNIIIEILWQDGSKTSSAICDMVKDRLHWSRQTVRTYLIRLIEKGLIGTKQVNKRTLLYYPIVSREAYAVDKARNILGKFFDSVPDMIASILQNEKVTDADLDNLENMIQKLRQKEDP
jgi:BlaI family transcriptional regulator, penicillinase repressor